MACLTVGQAGRAPAGRGPPPRPVRPRAENGVTFLVPQELNASRPATPKMDSAMMTVCAGNGGAPQRQLVAGTGWGGRAEFWGAVTQAEKARGPWTAANSALAPTENQPVGERHERGTRTGVAGDGGGGGAWCH